MKPEQFPATDDDLFLDPTLIKITNSSNKSLIKSVASTRSLMGNVKMPMALPNKPHLRERQAMFFQDLRNTVIQNASDDKDVKFVFHDKDN